MTKARTLADNFAADINAITAGTGITGGGTSGTVTVTNSMATAIDAKGDLVVGTGADTFSRLAVGANDTVLVAASGEATGLKWAAPAGGITYNNISTSATSPITDFTNGNATIIHRYAQSGKFVHQFLQYTWGSTTSVGGGASLLRLQNAVTIASGYSIFSAGVAYFYDSSANQLFVGTARIDDQSIYLYVEDDLGTYTRVVNSSNTVPFTWANGDILTVNVVYEAA